MNDESSRSGVGGCVVYLAGVTACGKSAVAARVAAQLQGEVVCGDSYQLLAGLPVLTAQPEAGELVQAPHWLYGSQGVGEVMNAGRYAELARPVVQDVQERGAVPVVVGGSGLYLKALTHGLSGLPGADAPLRQELDRLSGAEAVAQLLRLDPRAGESINLRNPRHVQRALEISLLSGRPASEVKQSFARGPHAGAVGIVLVRSRDDVVRRIEERTRRMVSGGVVGEVLAVGGRAGTTAASAIGFREFAAVGRGEIPLEEAVAAVAVATRQYAKRQASWFRRELWMEPVAVEDGDTVDEVAARVLTLLRARGVSGARR
jgi:tRNA dimethylallyltransferase